MISTPLSSCGVLSGHALTCPEMMEDGYWFDHCSSSTKILYSTEVQMSLQPLDDP